MKSSTSAVGRISAGAGVRLPRWTPELLGPAAAPPPGPAEVQARVDTAVREALAAAALEREAAERALLEAEGERRTRLVREAYERGHEEGRAEGERGEAARLRSAVVAAEQALGELRAGEMRWTGTIEENVCALAVVIARQVIGRELANDPDFVIDLVRSALAEFPIDQPIRIRINPSDLNALASVGAVEESLLMEVTRARDARWLPDASIAPGGCVVEGRERIIDGRVDTALERVYRRLTYTHA